MAILDHDEYQKQIEALNKIKEHLFDASRAAESERDEVGPTRMYENEALSDPAARLASRSICAGRAAESERDGVRVLRLVVIVPGSGGEQVELYHVFNRSAKKSPLYVLVVHLLDNIAPRGLP